MLSGRALGLGHCLWEVSCLESPVCHHHVGVFKGIPAIVTRCVANENRWLKQSFYCYFVGCVGSSLAPCSVSWATAVQGWMRCDNPDSSPSPLDVMACDWRWDSVDMLAPLDLYLTPGQLRAFAFHVVSPCGQIFYMVAQWGKWLWNPFLKQVIKPEKTNVSYFSRNGLTLGFSVQPLILSLYLYAPNQATSLLCSLNVSF